MTNINNISNAFLNFAEKQENYEKIVLDLIQFNLLYKKNNSVKSLILSKRIANNDKNKILTSSIGSLIDKSVIEFILLLSKYKSIKQLSKIVQLIETNYKDRQGIINVDIISTTELDSSLIESITSTIKSKYSKKAIVNKVIDEKLIAGLKLKIGNTILDGTVASKLKKLKNNLINSN